MRLRLGGLAFGGVDRYRPAPMKLSVLLIATVACPAATLSANAAVGDWVAADHMQLRLVATPSGDGRLEGVIEIALDPGWHTYWRSPGDAGIGPRFDFAGSENLGEVAVRFPAPERYDDGFSTSNVYHNAVSLPFEAAMPEASRAVSLQFAADLGVCEKICLPVRVTAALDVPAGSPDPEAAALVSAARAALPGPAESGVFAVETVSRVGGTDAVPEYEVTVSTPRIEGTELFVEPPAHWYPSPPTLAGTKDGKALFRFTADCATAKGSPADAAFRFTIVIEGRAVEQIVPLGSTAAAP